MKLNLVLVAVEERKYEGGNILVNPRNKPITPNIIGLFLTTSSDAAKRAWFYCRVCHENLENVEDLKRCSCKKLAKARFDYFSKGQEKRGKFVVPHHNGAGAVSSRQLKSSEGGLRRRKITEEKTEPGRQDTAKVGGVDDVDCGGCGGGVDQMILMVVVEVELLVLMLM